MGKMRLSFIDSDLLFKAGLTVLDNIWRKIVEWSAW